MREYPQKVVDHYRPYRPLLIYLIVVVLGLLLWGVKSFAQQPVPFEEPCRSNTTSIEVIASIERRNDNWGFAATIENQSADLSVTSWEWSITGGGVFDFFNGDESVVPAMGGNNDGQNASIVTYTPDIPVAPGVSHVKNGDIDGTVAGFGVTITMDDGTVLDNMPLVANGDIWSASFLQVATATELTGCRKFNQSMIWTMTGEERTISWSEHADDVAFMDLYYRFEGLEFPPEEGGVPFMTAEYPEGDHFQVWTPVRARAAYFRVKSCRTDIDQDGTVQNSQLRPGTTDEWILCSRWGESLNPEDTDADVFPRGFIIIVELAPATGGTIE